jgi:pimeloyl-ACP methyl ester carboxylesterase
VHGWMDVAASWQFMVDALSRPRWIVAPDWRGYGLTRVSEPAPDNFWFADYLADLDFLLDQVAPGQAVDLVGHSMGGNVAMMYAGVRPERIRRLVNLEGFGMPETRPAQAPGRYAQWMDELKALHRGEMDLKAYDSADGVARRLTKTNPRLTEDKAAWLARQWAAPDADGRWTVLGDPAHKVVNAHLYQLPEALAIYARIAAPVLSVTASDDSLGQWWKGRFTLAQYQERLRHVPKLTEAFIDDAGHMLHHDQPQALARLIEDFLAE